MVCYGNVLPCLCRVGVTEIDVQGIAAYNPQDTNASSFVRKYTAQGVSDHGPSVVHANTLKLRHSIVLDQRLSNFGRSLPRW